MRRLRVTVLDIVAKESTQSLWNRVMGPNFASIMPQAVAVWCEQAGHDVTFVCHTGGRDLLNLPDDVDVLFVSAFTHAALVAYALSARARKKGAVTVLGGPHARAYPEDAARYFDYVLGFTDRTVIGDVLLDAAPHRPMGLRLGAKKQPPVLPGVKERWKFIAPTIAKAPAVQIVPMIGSLGCPYTCSFCIDAEVEYQALPHDQIREDLRFLMEKMARPCVGWHDPNFGVRFDETMSAIEEVVPPGAIRFAAESSLSLLSEPHLARLKKNGFQAILPGIESWFSLGNKSKTGANVGMDKVRQVSEHVNTILRYVPYVQTNFVLGLDDDHGAEPFELTKRFLDATPGAFPAYSLLSAFGESAPLNLNLQRQGRVLPTPFHFLDNHGAMNVRPKNYSWTQIYDLLIDVREHSFSWRAIGRRLAANRGSLPRSLNFVRAISSEGFGRIRYDRTVRHLLDADRGFRGFLEGDTSTVPSFYVDRIRRDLGPLWESLPEQALDHDPNAYLKLQPALPAASATGGLSPA